MKKSISLLTLMHNDFEFIDIYTAGLRNLVREDGRKVEALIYLWDCDTRFASDAKAQLNRVSGLTVTFFEGPNIGFSKGNNFLAACATGDLLFFLNPDATILRFDLNELEEIDTKKCVIEPLVSTGDFDPNSSAPSLPYKYYLANDFLFYPQISNSSKKQTYIDGAALIIERTHFEFLGGFDENIFVFQEDMELGLRNLNLGGDFLRLQNSQVHHFSGGTVVGGASRPNNDRHPTSIFRRIQAEQNQLYLAWISYPRILSCFWLPFWICLNLAGSLILVVRGEFKLSLSPWLGLRGFVRILRTAPASARRSRLQTKVIRRFGFVPSKLIVFFKLGVPTLKVR